MGISFGSGKLVAVPTADATGAAIAQGQPVAFADLQECGIDINFETKLLTGGRQFALAAGRGKGSISAKAKTATFSGALFADLLFGTGSQACTRTSANGVAGVVGPGGTVTAVPPSGGTFVANLGVVYAATGVPLKPVASAPAQGQYTVSAAGVYGFNVADVGAALLMDFEYVVGNTTSASGIITNQMMGYCPTFKAVLTANYMGKNTTLTLNACVAEKLSLPFKAEDFTVPEFEFKAMADANGVIGYWNTPQ